MTLRFVVVVVVTTDMFGAHGHQIDSWFHIRAEASGLCTNMRQSLQKQVHKWNHCNLNWKCSLQPLQTSQKNQHDVQNWSRVSQIPCESNHLRIRKCHQKYQFHPRSCVIMCIWSHYTQRDSGGIRSCEWRWRWRPRILHGPNLSCALFRIVREEKVQAQEDVIFDTQSGPIYYTLFWRCTTLLRL